MPIHEAVRSGNTDCVRVLVEHGATVIDRNCMVWQTFSYYRSEKCNLTIIWIVISFRGEVWAPRTGLLTPLSIEVLVPSQERELPCIFILMLSILPLLLRFVDWNLDLFRQCGIFVLFYFIFIDFEDTKWVVRVIKSQKNRQYKSICLECWQYIAT